MMTQTEAILASLAKRGRRGITPLEALNEHGCFRLGARIWDLKRKGHLISRELVKLDSGKRVARYWLVGGGST